MSDATTPGIVPAPVPAPDAPDAEVEARRSFLKAVGKVAVAAPAATLLLSAGTTPAFAESSSLYGCGSGGDFFGSNHERRDCERDSDSRRRRRRDD